MVVPARLDVHEHAVLRARMVGLAELEILEGIRCIVGPCPRASQVVRADPGIDGQEWCDERVLRRVPHRSQVSETRCAPPGLTVGGRGGLVGGGEEEAVAVPRLGVLYGPGFALDDAPVTAIARQRVAVVALFRGIDGSVPAERAAATLSTRAAHAERRAPTVASARSRSLL